MEKADLIAQICAEDTNNFYTYLRRHYSSTEDHFFHPNLSDEDRQKGYEMSTETFLVLQDALAKLMHSKANIPINTQIPVDYLVENARIDGAINALRGILDMAHNARHSALLKKSNLA